MPTGYTAIIGEKPDLAFREFALRCARAMGACIMQRDSPIDELPKAPEPSDYYEKSKRTAEAKLVELRGLTAEGKLALWQADCERIERENADNIAKAKESERRYSRMRAMVEAWTPPTKDHEGFRKFMLDQIDASSSDWKPYIVESAPTPGDWYANELKNAEWSLEYAIKNGAEEVERTNQRKAWIDALYASVS
jgi:hypothetical protein